MARQPKRDKGYLIAYPSGFPGTAIPLLSDEECRRRGIEPGRLPPLEAWTQEQRDAGHRFLEILYPHVFREALQIILDELERQAPEPGKSEVDQEREAAQRGVQLLDAGGWKQRDTFMHFPSSWVREILERFARGDLSILDEKPASKRKPKRPCATDRPGVGPATTAREVSHSTAGGPLPPSPDTESPLSSVVLEQDPWQD